MIEVPRGTVDTPGLCWIPVTVDGKAARPWLKCACGDVCLLGRHHIRENGIVTASFFHSVDADIEHHGITYTFKPGCGLRVWMRLMDYDQGNFSAAL